MTSHFSLMQINIPGCVFCIKMLGTLLFINHLYLKLYWILLYGTRVPTIRGSIPLYKCAKRPSSIFVCTIVIPLPLQNSYVL